MLLRLFNDTTPLINNSNPQQREADKKAREEEAAANGKEEDDAGGDVAREGGEDAEDAEYLNDADAAEGAKVDADLDPQLEVLEDI